MAPSPARPAQAPGALPETASTHHHHRHGLMHFLMLIGTFFWASNIVAGKVVLRSMPSIALAQVRVTGAAVVFLALFALWPGRPPLRISLRDLGYLAATALFGITLNQIFFIGGIGRTSAAHAGLIVALGPVMVLILSSAMRLEALTLLKSAGAAISLAGVIVLTTGKPTPGSDATVTGDIIMLLGTAVFAYYTILLKKVANRWDAVTLNAVIFVLGAAMMLPVSARALSDVRWTGLPADAWWGIAFIVSCGSVLAYLIYAFALTELTATRVAAFNYLQPVIAAALGVWLLAEGITGQAIAGGALILFGVYLTEREGREHDVLATGRP
jgi:drug/metabolite transporter (DMT)-like permease